MIEAAPLRRFVAYGFASVAALGIDVATFLALMAMGLTAPIAAVGGYGLGIFAHWFASSRFVFAGRVAETGRHRAAQQGLFVASALVGMAITWGVVASATAVGLDPRLAKLGAIGASFVATFVLRCRFVFNERMAEASVEA
ncbi:GtrA family protein [Croceicoccus ponticola]|uniref:GtrA family protein n=1 Tax=Croceicoccus ponticola TaxID=2217664 RepID=A0A437GXC8_9SPHN|nr:GtrA family protein [Croceicoccus ponticola]RVQ67055.1 GtrA family protein [Croceicoccus ponticola]